MAKDSDVRLPHRLVVPIRDTPHAPIIFFEWAPLSGHRHRGLMSTVTAVVVGAGHCGLAMSRHLAARSIDHVVLERGEVANSWRTQRWDSLRLLTPSSEWRGRGAPGLDSTVRSYRKRLPTHTDGPNRVRCGHRHRQQGVPAESRFLG